MNTPIHDLPFFIGMAENQIKHYQDELAKENQTTLIGGMSDKKKARIEILKGQLNIFKSMLHYFKDYQKMLAELEEYQKTILAIEPAKARNR